MENQHRNIKGYRELSSMEIALMNEIKDKGNELGELISNLKGLRKKEANRLDNGESTELTQEQLKASGKAINIATENLKTGFMWLTRAVALPDSF